MPLIGLVHGPINEGVSSPPNGIVVDEGQVDHIQLVPKMVKGAATIDGCAAEFRGTIAINHEADCTEMTVTLPLIASIA